MVLSTLNGTAVSFQRQQLVNDQGTGVCQVCHTNTAYYKKNVQELTTRLPTLTAWYAMRTTVQPASPSGRTAPATPATAIPPLPATYLPVTFGIQGNWSSARFEDYSGGGGAHVVAGHIPEGYAKPSDGWAN